MASLPVFSSNTVLCAPFPKKEFDVKNTSKKKHRVNYNHGLPAFQKHDEAILFLAVRGEQL